MSSHVAIREDVAVALERVEDFSDSMQVRACENAEDFQVMLLTATAEEKAREVLADVASRVAGGDWAKDNPEFLRQCAEAGLNYDALLTIPQAESTAQEDDLERKELGDLGELLALFDLLAYRDADPRQVFPKNILKLYERVSEPGIDTIALSMDLESEEVSRLLSGESATLVESKASSTASYPALAQDAATSLNRISPYTLQRELKLMKAELASRGARRAAARVPFFLVAFVNRLPSVRLMALLTCPHTPVEPVSFVSLAELAEERPLSVTLVPLDVDAAREVVFAFRRNDE